MINISWNCGISVENGAKCDLKGLIKLMKMCMYGNLKSTVDVQYLWIRKSMLISFNFYLFTICLCEIHPLIKSYQCNLLYITKWFLWHVKLIVFKLIKENWHRDDQSTIKTWNPLDHTIQPFQFGKLSSPKLN